MTSELNLTDEGELHEEEKPRLVIGDKVPPSLHHGHKLDMNDRDPIKMNDHVKVKCKLYLFGERYFCSCILHGPLHEETKNVSRLFDCEIQEKSTFLELITHIYFMRNKLKCRKKTRIYPHW